MAREVLGQQLRNITTPPLADRTTRRRSTTDFPNFCFARPFSNVKKDWVVGVQ